MYDHKLLNWLMEQSLAESTITTEPEPTTVKATDILQQIEQLHHQLNEDKVRRIRESLVWLVGGDNAAGIHIDPGMVIWVSMQRYIDCELDQIPWIQGSFYVARDQVLLYDPTQLPQRMTS